MKVRASTTTFINNMEGIELNPQAEKLIEDYLLSVLGAVGTGK